MRGHTWNVRQGDKTNAGEEFLYRLSLRRGFQDDLKKARAHLDIPDAGFASKEDHLTWLEQNMHRMLDVLSVNRSLLEKYKIPLAYYAHLETHIDFGGRGAERVETVPVVVDFDVDESQDLGALYRELGEPYVRLFILGNAQKTDVLDFISKHWEPIENALYVQRGGPRARIRKTTHKDRNQLIRDLWKKSVATLQEQAGNSKRKLKESLIQKILEEKGYGIVSDGYIRKMGGQK